MKRRSKCEKKGKQSWEGRWERDGVGGCWSSNQQLTGVRMFMGRVSLSDWSSSQFSCGLKHSFPLILKLRRKKERKTKKTNKHVHFQLWGRKSVHTKSKRRLSVCKLNCLTLSATTSFLQLGSPSAGRKARFLDVRVCQNRSRWLTAPSYLPHPDFNKFDSSLSAFPRITERCGWADMKTPQWDFKLEKKKNQHSPTAVSTYTTRVGCGAVCVFGAHIWESPVSLRQTLIWIKCNQSDYFPDLRVKSGKKGI